MVILSTVFICVSYIKYLTTSLCQMKLSDLMSETDFQNVQNNLKDNMMSVKPISNHLIVVDTIFEDN